MCNEFALIGEIYLKIHSMLARFNPPRMYRYTQIPRSNNPEWRSQKNLLTPNRQRSSFISIPKFLLEYLPEPAKLTLFLAIRMKNIGSEGRYHLTPPQHT